MFHFSISFTGADCYNINEAHQWVMKSDRKFLIENNYSEM